MSSMGDTNNPNDEHVGGLSPIEEGTSQSKAKNLSYTCLAAHFIDHDWKLHKRIINFCVISSHKGEAIGQAVESCMIQWGIEKVCTITEDNASSNDTVVRYLKKKISKRNGFILDSEFFHMRCCAHILNLIVENGISEVTDSISRIRGAVRYIRSSPSRAQRFKSCVEKERITCKSSHCLDVPTRSNSTYNMLKIVLKFRKAFEWFGDEDVLFVAELKDGCPNDEDWDNARVLTQFLKFFYEATLRLTGSLYVTSNSYFHEVFKFERLLYESSKSGDVYLSMMASKMKGKFDKYWGNIDKINMMLLVAVVLDPRFKLKYIKFCYSKLYTSEKLLLQNFLLIDLESRTATSLMFEEDDAKKRELGHWNGGFDGIPCSSFFLSIWMFYGLGCLDVILWFELLFEVLNSTVGD
ncbi:zinc finger BED domain-containing protein RICESLEEPER 2-like [Tasmannia lanceolata]|uniref:zinc finger BED domain-containing protein RICESLEEPER 2-like n=1 Tax=Tasmannia lanceolata TaxID=3420 RepID=UPI0040645CF8